MSPSTSGHGSSSTEFHFLGARTLIDFSSCPGIINRWDRIPSCRRTKKLDFCSYGREPNNPRCAAQRSEYCPAISCCSLSVTRMGACPFVFPWLVLNAEHRADAVRRVQWTDWSPRSRLHRAIEASKERGVLRCQAAVISRAQFRREPRTPYLHIPFLPQRRICEYSNRAKHLRQRITLASADLEF